jgi:hypothetical protein
MRKSTVYLIFLMLSGAALLLLLVLQPSAGSGARINSEEEKLRLVRELTLTDLCLFTEARYTRHLSQADLHSAFQDHPGALDHFPSGSMVLPPLHLQKALSENLEIAPSHGVKGH